MLQKSGKDITKHKPPTDPNVVDKMYTSRVLSNLNPVSLQRKVFVELGTHCSHCEGKVGGNFRRIVLSRWLRLEETSEGLFCQDG